MNRDKIQQTILKKIFKTESGRLILAPRIGKTKLLIDLIKRDTPNSILWVSPTTRLLTEDLPEEFKKWGAEKYLEKLTVSTWKSLSKIKGNFDLIVLDEEQFITIRNSSTLRKKTLQGRIISMTGTEAATYQKQKIYEELNLDIIYEVSIDEAVDFGLLSDYQINVIEVEMQEEKNIHVKTGKWDFWTSEKKSYESIDRKTEKNKTKFNILNRMLLIKKSPTKIAVSKYLFNGLSGRSLIFTPNIEQAEKLCLYSYHSKTTEEDLNKFLFGSIDKIAMVNKGGVGYTYKKPIDNLIISQIDADKTGLTSQKISRALLKQDKEHTVQIWIICLLDTQDVVWVDSVLNNFNKDKVKVINFKNLKIR